SRGMFPDAQRFKLNEDPTPLLLDTDGNKIEPLRIALNHDKFSGVVLGVPQFCNCSNNPAMHSVTWRNPAKLVSQDLHLPSSALTPFFNSSLSTHNNTQNENINSNVEKIMEMLLEAKEKDDKILKMQSAMINLQLEAKEKDEQIIKLQLEAKEKGDKILKMQMEAINLQQQALDRLVILQQKADAIL
ncbi:hypothetical protein BX616_008718, partial [Lobosporangium transversale]